MRRAILAASVLALLAVPAIGRERDDVRPQPTEDQSSDVQPLTALRLPLPATTSSVPSENRCEWVAWMTGGCSR
jgi:hypothetical protein